MPTIPTQSFSAIVSQIAAGIQGRAAALVDFSVGSTLRAIAEGFGGVALWMQSEALQAFVYARAATAKAADLDSWVADFGLSRLGSNAATGYVQFSSFTATAIRYIPVGATLKTGDLSQTFTVIADTTNQAYDAANQRYVMAAGVAALIVPVQATTLGAAGNVAAQTVTLITSPMAGVDTAINLVAFSGGSDPETDAQLRTRFVAYILSLSKGTTGAYGYALSSLQLGLQYAIHENAVGSGIVTVYVDDGTGNIPSGVVQNAQAALNNYRAAGIQVAVLPATKYPVYVQMQIKVASGYLIANVTGAVSAAISAYINNLGLEQPLYYTRLSFIAYNTPGVLDVVFYRINGALNDVVPTAGQTLKSVGVSVAGGN